MPSICDDKLFSLISNELTRIGLFVGPSEVEKSIIQTYDRLIAAHDGTNFVLDSSNKDEAYYTFLSNAAIIDIFSKTRLPNVRNSFELNSALCLLDGYLYQLSIAANTERFSARELFDKVIIALPAHITATIQGSPKQHCQSCQSSVAQKENS